PRRRSRRPPPPPPATLRARESWWGHEQRLDLCAFTGSHAGSRPILHGAPGHPTSRTAPVRGRPLATLRGSHANREGDRIDGDPDVPWKAWKRGGTGASA